MAKIYGNTTATPIKPELLVGTVLQNKLEFWQPNTEYKVGDTAIGIIEQYVSFGNKSYKVPYINRIICKENHISGSSLNLTDMLQYWDTLMLSVFMARASYLDSAGNPIIDTYATKEELENSVKPQKQTFENDATITVTDNTEYVADGEITNLTIIYPDTDFICSFNFTLASEGSITITLPESKYIGSTPSFANGDTWELNIKNKVVVGGLVE